MTKDLSRSQYLAAAKRQGFNPCLYGLEDISGKTKGTIYGGVFDGNGKIRRRTTLAEAIKKRQKGSK